MFEGTVRASGLVTAIGTLRDMSPSFHRQSPWVGGGGTSPGHMPTPYIPSEPHWGNLLGPALEEPELPRAALAASGIHVPSPVGPSSLLPNWLLASAASAAPSLLQAPDTPQPGRGSLWPLCAKGTQEQGTHSLTRAGHLSHVSMALHPSHAEVIDSQQLTEALTVGFFPFFLKNMLCIYF